MRACKTCGKSFEGDGRRRYCGKHAPAKRVRSRPRPRHLRAVEAGEAPPVRHVPRTIAEAAEAGSTLDELRLTRARIARTLDDPNCPPRDLASLSRRLMELGREIDALERQQREVDADADVKPDETWDAEAL